MEGVMHTGQRNQFRIRISKDAYDKGLRLTHFAEVLYLSLIHISKATSSAAASRLTSPS